MEKRSIITRVSGSVWLPHGEGVVITVNKAQGGWRVCTVDHGFHIPNHITFSRHVLGTSVEVRRGYWVGETDYSSGLVDNEVARNVCIVRRSERWRGSSRK